MLETLIAFDRALGFWLAARLNDPWIDTLMIGVSLIGQKGAIWIALGLFTWLLRPAKGMAVWRLLLAIGLAGLLVDAVVKPAVGRARPFVDHPEYRDLGWRPTSASFPSGHAATAAAGAFALTRVWPATAPALAAWTLAALIAFSRVALGVHFPSDVLAGFALGAAAAWFVCARSPDPLRVASTSSRVAPPSSRLAEF